VEPALPAMEGEVETERAEILGDQPPQTAPEALPDTLEAPQGGEIANAAAASPLGSPGMNAIPQPPLPVAATLAVGQMPSAPPISALSGQSRLPAATGTPPVLNSSLIPPSSLPQSVGPGLMSTEPPLMAPQQGPLPGGMPMSTGGPPGSLPPYRQLKVEDALAYLDQVKMKFEKQPHIYNQFLDIMKEFKAQSIDTPGVIDRVLQLFHGHRELILGFNTFLPPGYKIEFSDDENKPRVQLKYPQGMTGPQPVGYGLNAPAPTSMMPQTAAQMGAMPTPPFQAVTPAPPETLSAPPPAQPPAQQPKKAPIEFDQAINYVTKIKTRFAKQPETYKAFLEILHTYQKEQRTIKEVYEQVSTLFKNHPDLLGEFSQFLPDGSPEASGVLQSQPKLPKGGKTVNMEQGRSGPQAVKQQVAQRPVSKLSVRQQADEEEERYWQKRKSSRKEESGKRSDEIRPPVNRSLEAEFFSKCRNRMPKPLYLELLKCLNLYSQQILERSELLTLVHDLFKRTQIELFTAFRRLLGYSGGEARDAPSPPASRAPVAEGGSFRELDFSSMKKHGTSYRILPDNYPMPQCSGRGPLEQLVLNDSWVSVATGTEDLNFKTMRKNQYEESIFRAEDERFELDTAIETNVATLHLLQPIHNEINLLTEPEKRRYKMPQPLGAMHCKSIRRLYGAQGSQVIELLQKCPAAAINPVIKRLQQKDDEYRSLRQQLAKGWKEVYEKNWTKSLDHRSFYFKQGDKKNFSGKQMVIELKGLTEVTENEGGEAAAAEVSDGSLSLPFKLKTSLQELHDDTLETMIFAAKLSFSLVVEEVDEKLTTFWTELVRPFFNCPDLEPAPAPAETDETLKTKPLKMVAADNSEDAATREARPPENRYAMPLSYPKTSNQLFVGNSHFYIFVRLYHVIIERFAAAKDMARSSQELAEEQDMPVDDEERAGGHGDEGGENGFGPTSAAISASAEQATRAALISSIKRDAGGDLYQAFLACLRQLIEGKMEASAYEDALRTLLGSKAYILFTLHKIISQTLKQLQMLLVEETSQRLLQLYGYERQRVSAGSMCEATYRNNARLLLEGDDCFMMEQMYGEGCGELVLSFLPEKEAEEHEGEEEDVDEDEEEEEVMDGAEKAEWAAYMDSFVQVLSSAQTARLKSSSAPLMLSRTARRTRARAWSKSVLYNGLECRAAVGTCKLRFVSRSEDLWFANTRRGDAKRKAAHDDTLKAKRQQLAKWVEGRAEGRPRELQNNALHGLRSNGPAQLPNATTWQPQAEA